MTRSTALAPEVAAPAGRVSGHWRADSAAFLGIPFARSPIGEYRFAAPERAAAWEGTRSALEYGATPQRRPFGSLTTIPEPSIPGPSTLNVNVFTPAPGDRDALLPVFVWIHGGGYFAGSPASPWYDGAAFNRDGVVTVSLSYRLGFDGFGWIDGAPLNRGILDQIAALEWVQDNIRSFGGDPGRVTIGGQSAGGGSVLSLLGSPRAHGLFHAAVSHSGPLNSMLAADAERIGRAYAASLGTEPTLAGWRSIDETTVLDTERAFNAAPGTIGFSSTPAEVVAGAADPRASGVGLGFSPTIDGDIVVDRLDAGAAIPLLLGSTANEFAFPTPGTTADDVEAALRDAGIGAEGIARYRGGVDRIGESFAHSQLLVSAMFRTAVARVTAERRASGAGERTWLYDFAWRSPVSGTSGHCIDLPFAWDVLGAEGVQAQLGATPPQHLADRMHADWVRFITDGRAEWEPAAASGFGARRFDDAVAGDDDAYAFDAELARLA